MRPSLVYFYIVYVMVSSERVIKKTRTPRLFTFNTLENDLNVNLEFSVPFITLPVKQTLETAFSLGLPTININLASLALGGAVIAGTTVLVPFLIKNQMHYKNPIERYSKTLLDNSRFGSAPLLEYAQQMMDSGTVSGCTLRIACWTGQRGHSDSRVWEYIKKYSNTFLPALINSTAVDEALSSGYKGRDCSNFYHPCPLREEQIFLLIKNVNVLTNNSL